MAVLEIELETSDHYVLMCLASQPLATSKRPDAQFSTAQSSALNCILLHINEHVIPYTRNVGDPAFIRLFKYELTPSAITYLYCCFRLQRPILAPRRGEIDT